MAPGEVIYGKTDYKLLKEQFVLKGIPSSAGIVLGKALVLQPETIITPTVKIPDEEISNELLKFEKAHANLVHQFMQSLHKVHSLGSNVIAILETNLLILTDPLLYDGIRSKIMDGFSVESAIVSEFDNQRKFFLNSSDAFLRERANEIDNIKRKLLSALKNQCLDYENAQDSIVVAQALTTSDIVNFKEAGILAIVTEVGGITSHASILARSLDIPAVIGVHNATDLIPNGEEIIVDGFAGIIVVKPKEDIRIVYLNKIEALEEHKRNLGALAKLPAETTDGRRIALLGNVNFLDDVRTGEINGADGYGLVRSENLVMELKGFPDEDTQYNWYREICERAYPKTVTIRVFDLGSDKYVEGLPIKEFNPALGLRGIRFLLSRQDIFETQLRALLRASVNKNLKIMLPMITSLHEVEFSRKILEKCKAELKNEGVLFDANIPFGVMIETPAAAVISDGLARAVDFFSIGTNDLTQYTLAADRNNELVSDIFDDFHPAVLRLIDYIIKSAHKNGITVSICGELAGHAAATELLIGMDVDELSVAPSLLLELKNRVRNLNYAEAKLIAQEILNSQDYYEVRTKLEKAIGRHNLAEIQNII